MNAKSPPSLWFAIVITPFLLLLAGSPISGWSAEQTASAQALQLLTKLDKATDIFANPGSDARGRIAKAVGQWKDGQTNVIFIGDGYGAGDSDPSIVEKAIGKPTRVESFEELKQLATAMTTVVRAEAETKGIALLGRRAMAYMKLQLKDGSMIVVVVDKNDEGKQKLVPLVDVETKRCLPGKVLWYDSVGFGFVKTAHQGEFLAILLTQPPGDLGSAPQKEKAK